VLYGCGCEYCIGYDVPAAIHKNKKIYDMDTTIYNNKIYFYKYIKNNLLYYVKKI
jgi:hypothetical protein